MWLRLASPGYTGFHFVLESEYGFHIPSDAHPHYSWRLAVQMRNCIADSVGLKNEGRVGGRWRVCWCVIRRHLYVVQTLVHCIWSVWWTWTGGKRPFYRHAYIYYNLFSPRSVALCHVQQLQVVVERLLLLTDHKPLVSHPYTSLSGSVCLEWVSKARCVCDCTLVLVQKVVLYIT